MQPKLTLLLCLAPVAVIFIVMKLAVWMSAANGEVDYVRREPLRKRGPVSYTHLTLPTKA